jgi:choline dehydrogenase-like flavoprotein
LESHGIPVVVDNPSVGERLQDHAIASQSFEVADNIPSGNSFRDPAVLKAMSELYAKNGEGPLGMSTLVNAYLPLVDKDGPVSAEEKKTLPDSSLNHSPEFGCLRSIVESPDVPTAEYTYLPFQLVITPEPKSLTEIITPTYPEDYVSLITVLNHLFSRGSVHITSSDVTVLPEWDPKYMSHPLDLEILARHVQFGEKLVRTEPFSKILKPGGKRMPAMVGDDLERAKEIVRQRQISIFHPTGSLAMLPREHGGVVNERLIVHGTRNLRVVDASIFPLQPSETAQATVYAVAERAADLIKVDQQR